VRLNVEGTDWVQEIQAGGLNLAVYGQGASGGTLFGFLGGDDSYLGPQGDMRLVASPVLRGTGRRPTRRCRRPCTARATRRCSRSGTRPDDIGAGAQWDDHGPAGQPLAPGATAT
jgi:hypothetical protein